MSNPSVLWSSWLALRPTILQGIRTNAGPDAIEALRKEIRWNATVFAAPIPPELRTAARLESSQHASVSRWCRGGALAAYCSDPCAMIETNTRLKPARDYLSSMARGTPFDPSIEVTVTVDGEPQVSHPYSDALDILQFRLRRERDGGEALVATYLRILNDLDAGLAPPPPPAMAP